jgi:hypothetical protein
MRRCRRPLPRKVAVQAPECAVPVEVDVRTPAASDALLETAVVGIVDACQLWNAKLETKP